MGTCRVAVVGDGGWGTALSLLLHERGAHVRIWSAFPDYVREVVTRRENRLYLPGVSLPHELEWTADPAEAVARADVVVLAVPSRYWRSVLERFRGLVPTRCRVLSVAKGLDPQNRERLSQVAWRLLDVGPVSVLSGPSLAPEVARGLPTAVTVASEDPEAARQLQRLFHGPRFRVYTSTDVIGVELGGALKNIIALAAGVCDGLNFGDNARAALITRGLAEMTRLGTVMGARRETFYGLSGMGDLVLTCTSPHSRNHQVGERLGRGESIGQIVSGMKQVAEGVTNAPIVWELAQGLGVDMPVTAEVCAVLEGRRRPLDAVRALMERDLKAE